MVRNTDRDESSNGIDDVFAFLHSTAYIEESGIEVKAKSPDGHVALTVGSDVKMWTLLSLDEARDLVDELQLVIEEVEQQEPPE